jgi:epoxide hydrolase-like predicted phosphatase
MRIKAIIFDLGGVVVELDFSRFFKDVIEMSPLNMPNSTLLLEFWRQSDTYHQGKMSNEDFYKQACELLQTCAIDQQQFFNSFNSVISHIRGDILDLIEKIRTNNKIKVLCLSNVNFSHWQYLKQLYPKILESFDDYILSFEVHLTKPDTRIFDLAINKTGCKPREILFIDDGLNNVRSASEKGINGIKFTNLENLRLELKKFDIKV